MQSSAGASAVSSPDDRAPAPGRRPVDLVHLARYTFGNRSLEREVLRLFLSQSQACLRRLKEAGGDDQAWRDAAHTLTGSARAIGAWGVAHLAEQAQALPATTPSTERERLLDVLASQIGDTNDFIRALLTET